MVRHTACVGDRKNVCICTYVVVVVVVVVGCKPTQELLNQEAVGLSGGGAADHRCDGTELIPNVVRMRSNAWQAA